MIGGRERSGGVNRYVTSIVEYLTSDNDNKNSRRTYLRGPCLHAVQTEALVEHSGTTWYKHKTALLIESNTSLIITVLYTKYIVLTKGQ